jgi:hypothetical protein
MTWLQHLQQRIPVKLGRVSAFLAAALALAMLMIMSATGD